MDRAKMTSPDSDAFHVISTGQQTPEQLAAISEQIIHYADAIHLREKSWTDKQLTQTVSKLQAKGVPLEKIMINHRAAVAHNVGAKGVQLTHASKDIATTRHAYPELHIGASVHSTEEAINACKKGADYLIFGHVFETRSKPDLEPKGLTALKNVVQQVDIPVLAIGGITPENTTDVMETGASGIAVLSGVLLAENPLQKAAAYNNALRKGGERRV
ncbi:thiazole tautomerase (transcriptional regulator TenI) [Lentibacillus persicus]|uniref:Thiazole tautomerase (Transcriptional regulator TenI) n=1 Tax=Lentibacillus persicus TaxID=640948 RepID=A0A1I1YYN1_9BACI|nr:thiamine phosphate synthase [Lentibacillus persicus]SFE24402.1 thiazole tautomerase (transcriptional regulator TenI) [Lentibacillus persicus]